MVPIQVTVVMMVDSDGCCSGEGDFRGELIFQTRDHIPGFVNCHKVCHKYKWIRQRTNDNLTKK
jgi:hypothetical protein